MIDELHKGFTEMFEEIIAEKDQTIAELTAELETYRIGAA